MTVGLLLFRDRESRVRANEELLMAAAKRLKARIRPVYVPELHFYFGLKNRVLERGKAFPRVDIMIAQPIFTKEVGVNPSLIKQVEMSGITVFNRYLSVLVCKDKIRTSQVLGSHGIPMPKTIVVDSPEFIEGAAERIGKYPIVVKNAGGSYGVGVLLAESKRSIKPVTQHFLVTTNEPIMLQEFVSESKGRDIRVFIVGKKIVAAMERIAPKGEFRSNFELGGKVRVASLTEAEKRIAIRATEALKLDYGGVDIIRTKEGPKILEVNANPGFPGITEATGVDVAEKVLRYAINKAKKIKALKGSGSKAKKKS